MTTPTNGRRVLLSAYQCGPGLGSVSQIGWEWFRRLARRTPTTLVTHVRNRDSIAAAGGLDAGAEILFVDTEWFAGPLYRTGRKIFPQSEHAVFLVSSLDFFVYEREAERILRERIAKGERWDLVHVVTPVSFAAPSRLHRLGLPVVRGPLNSGLGNPPGFSEVVRTESSWLAPVRNLSRLADAALGSTRHTERVLVATRATEAAVPRRYRDRCVRMLENGVDVERFVASEWPPAPRGSEPLRLSFVGRLIASKALPLLLGAVREVRRHHPVELRVVGDGPLREAWEAQARREGIDGSVTFLGNLSHELVAQEMRRAHVFVLPSVRESGGGVLLEAMACGRPVVGVDFGGPAELIDDEVGALLPLTNPQGLVRDLARTLVDVIDNPEQWAARGRAGRERAQRRFSWDAKIEAALAIYEDVLSAAPKKSRTRAARSCGSRAK